MNRSPRAILALAAVLAMLLSGVARGDDVKTGQHAQVLEKQVPIRLNYLLYVPEAYGKEAEKKFPVILFLHGAGERGEDVNRVKIHGPPKLIEQKKESPVNQFVVISPQCPPGRWWMPHELIALLDEVLEKHPQADRDRVYLTGLSMGGYGTWDTATRYPERFAAIAPICGGGDARRAARALRNMPTWAFHGDKDTAVPVQESIDMVEALKRAGGEPKLTRYPEAGHDSWTETYNNPELYQWFLEHKRQERQQRGQREPRRAQ